MHAPGLLLSAALLARAAALPEGAGRAPMNPLAGPARCVLRYLDAVRLAGPRTPLARRAPPDARAGSARDAARRLLAPLTLVELELRAAQGAQHPLAIPRDPATQPVLESFRLVGARRAARGAAVVTVSERFWRAPPQRFETVVSEYLVGRVGGEWRIVDRRPRGAFTEREIATAYARFFDAPEER